MRQVQKPGRRERSSGSEPRCRAGMLSDAGGMCCDSPGPSHVLGTPLAER